MRTTRVFVIGFVLLLGGSGEVCQAQALQTGPVIDSRLGGGFLITHTDDPTQDFNTAQKSFLDLDFIDAAVNIRRGAQQMREALADATDDSRQALRSSLTELESLAQAVEQRRVNSEKQLEEVFARANHAMAQRHYLLALRAREQLAEGSMRQELRRSAEYLQRARQQIGLQIREDETQVIERAQAVRSNLTARVNATSDEVTREFRSMEHSLASLGERLGIRTTVNDQPTLR